MSITSKLVTLIAVVGVAAIGGLALLLVVLAFIIGRSRGRKKYAFIEVRRG